MCAIFRHTAPMRISERASVPIAKLGDASPQSATAMATLAASHFLEKYMRPACIPLVVVLALAACGGGADGIREDAVSVFKYTGSVQCAGGGLSLSTMQGQLLAANVQVRSASCGADGMAYPGACGGPDGRLGIFQVPAAQVQAAGTAGFTPLSTLPLAGTVPCT